MQSHFGKLIGDAMTAKGLDRTGLACAVGFRKLEKGVRQVNRWLDGECPKRMLFDRLVDALGIAPADLSDAYRWDRMEEQQTFVKSRLKEPDYIVSIVPFAGFAMKRTLPAGLSIEEAMQGAIEMANGCRFSLDAPQGVTYFARNGEIYCEYEWGNLIEETAFDAG